MYNDLLNESDEIISIHISSKISGTFMSAAKAAQEVNPARIRVFDSCSTAAGLEFMVIEAAEMAKQQRTSDEIIDKLKLIRNNLCFLFIVDNLKYLQEGGRIGKASAILGTLLHIKPILYINGEVGVFDKVRTQRKALIKIVEELEKIINKSNDIEEVSAILLHVENKQSIEELYKTIKEKWPELKLNISSCGPVIGSHVGTGALGIAFWHY